MSKLRFLALLGGLAWAWPVAAQTIIIQTRDVQVSRGLAAPGNVGLWVRNLAGRPLVCGVSWRNPNGPFGDSRQIRLAPGETELIATGLLATSGETVGCRSDPQAGASDNVAADRGIGADDESFLYFVQAASFRDEGMARASAMALRRMYGDNAAVSVAPQGHFRVRMGPYASLAQARAVAERLRSGPHPAYHDAVVVRRAR